MNESNQTDTVFVLRELRSLLAGDGAASLAMHVDEELEKLRDNKFHLVVLGQFKRGKTTFLNALLGVDLLPVGVLPLTAVVTMLHHGPRTRITVVFNDDRRKEIQADELVDFVAEQKNPRNMKNVRYVEIAHPSQVLRDGLVLVDTPGVGSVFEHNTELTRRFIPKVDAAILVVSTDPPITQTEYELLGELVQHVEHVFIVLNKTDLVRESELREVLEFTQGVIKSKLPEQSVRLHPLSASRALEGRRRGDESMVAHSGIREIEAALAEFGQTRQADVLQKQTRRRVHDLLSRARFETELALNALQMPLVDLEKRVKEFENQIAHILRKREESAYLLQGEVRSLERWIDAQVATFSAAEIASLTEALPRWASELSTSSFNRFLRPLEERLAKTIVADFDGWRSQFSPMLMERYEALTERYVQEINKSIETIVNLSGDLFATSMQPTVRCEPIRWQQRFYYDFQNESFFLGFDVLKRLSALLPSSLARRWFLARLLRSVKEKVNRVCNGLQYEYSYSLQESYRNFRTDLNQQMDAVIHEVRSVLQQAAVHKAATERAQTEILRHRLERLAALQHDSRIP